MVDCPGCGMTLQLPTAVPAPAAINRRQPIGVREITSVVGTVEMVRAAERIDRQLTAINWRLLCCGFLLMALLIVQIISCTQPTRLLLQ